MIRTSSGRQHSAALIVAAIALIAALAGTATAQRNKIGTDEIKNHAVTSSKLARKAVKGAKIKPKSVKRAKLDRHSVNAGKIAHDAVGPAKLKPESVRGSKVADDSLGVNKLSQSALISPEPVPATAGPDANAARAAAPATELFANGPLTLYGKCYTDSSANETHAAIFAATEVGGAVLSSGGDSLPGGPFLDPGTGEGNRFVVDATAGTDAASDGRSSFHLAAPDGPSVQGLLTAYAKNGNVPAQAIYGDGDTCLFSGEVQG